MLAAMSVIVLFYTPIQFYIAYFLSKKRGEIAKITDQRVRIMNEVLNAMKLVKLFAWESSFAERVRIIQRVQLSSTSSVIDFVHHLDQYIASPGNQGVFSTDLCCDDEHPGGDGDS